MGTSELKYWGLKVGCVGWGPVKANSAFRSLNFWTLKKCAVLVTTQEHAASFTAHLIEKYMQHPLLWELKLNCATRLFFAFYGRNVLLDFN